MIQNLDILKSLFSNLGHPAIVPQPHPWQCQEVDESRVGAGAGRARGCTEVDSKALSCSQMVAKAVTRFQVDQTALELDKVVGSLSCHWSSHLGPNPNTCQHQEWKI